ncbi:hypothetical protein FIV00_20075 [Labrenzia sp. THAF82]|uniref:acyl carrier protein n=1 Tax=Labrenzia sp. THAF82 TaxID=2587861 RepID=UPI0012A8C15B|nr:acyl carrier protein [Labrenzia sp. THAF82]QFT32799.1 hypothetical protein FIV00_20075 [Labrenzia sp. THAF82]
MSENIEKYQKCFMEAFPVQKQELEGLKYQDIPEWDSIGHMNLVAALEDEFGIEMEIDDITDISDFRKGKEVLLRYEITI